nr:hypothetical protein [Chloroflexota bacterium]
LYRTLPGAAGHQVDAYADLTAMRLAIVIFTTSVTPVSVMLYRVALEAEVPAVPSGVSYSLHKADGSAWVNGSDDLAALAVARVTGSFTTPDPAVADRRFAVFQDREVAVPVGQALPIDVPGPFVAGPAPYLLGSENESAFSD